LDKPDSKTNELKEFKNKEYLVVKNNKKTKKKRRMSPSKKRWLRSEIQSIKLN